MWIRSGRGERAVKVFLDTDIPDQHRAVAGLHRGGFAIVQVLNESTP
jgi:hypothetical protein